MRCEPGRLALRANPLSKKWADATVPSSALPFRWDEHRLQPLGETAPIHFFVPPASGGSGRLLVVVSVARPQPGRADSRDGATLRSGAFPGQGRGLAGKPVQRWSAWAGGRNRADANPGN